MVTPKSVSAARWTVTMSGGTLRDRLRILRALLQFFWATRHLTGDEKLELLVQSARREGLTVIRKEEPR